MARSKSGTWIAIICLLVGALGATIFWRYSSYGHDQLAQPAAEDLKTQTLPGAGKAGTLSLKKLAGQAIGPRYQMVTDGRQVFLVDLQNGRVWRYFHNTKEAGFSKEDEGFLPLALYYAGQRHNAASEIEPPPGAPGNPSPAGPPGKQPQ
jgi:hypothetical protein